MILYLIAFFVIMYYFFISYGNERMCHDNKFLAVSLFVLCSIASFADMLGGYDRYIYCQFFDITADIVRSGGYAMSYANPLVNQYPSEWIYDMWNVLIAHFTQNRYMFIVITTFVIYIVLYKNFKEYFDNYPMAMLAFLGLWYFFTFTYLRQVMAACTAMIAYRYVLQRKKWKFLLCAFIAYRFHNSAIIFMPFYFLPVKKWPAKKVRNTMIFLFLIGVSGAPMLLYGLYGSASDDTGRTAAYGVDSGARTAYAIEAALFLYYILKRYDRIKEDDTKTLVFLNSALCFCGILLAFIRSENAGRQSWYFMIGIIYILCYLSKSRTGILDSYSRQLVVILFLLYIRIINSWGYQLSPYKTFFTDSYREGDYIAEICEYDWIYERDKFYRPMISIYLENWSLWPKLNDNEKEDGSNSKEKNK